jgi:hypothetical protein
MSPPARGQRAIGRFVRVPPVASTAGGSGVRGERFWLLLARLRKVTGPARPQSALVACKPPSPNGRPHPNPLPRCGRGSKQRGSLIPSGWYQLGCDWIAPYGFMVRQAHHERGVRTPSPSPQPSPALRARGQMARFVHTIGLVSICGAMGSHLTASWFDKLATNGAYVSSPHLTSPHPHPHPHPSPHYNPLPPCGEGANRRPIE